MSSKDIEKMFVGQPIFKQLIDFIPKNKFDLLAQKHQTDRYYKAFPAWTQLVTLLFGFLVAVILWAKFAMECWPCKAN